MELKLKELNVRWSLQSLEWLLEVIEEKGQEVEVGIEEDDQEVILDLEVEVEVGDIEVGQEVEKGGLEDTGIGPEVDLEIEDEDLDRKIAIEEEKDPILGQDRGQDLEIGDVTGQGIEGDDSDVFSNE